MPPPRRPSFVRWRCRARRLRVRQAAGRRLRVPRARPRPACPTRRRSPQPARVRGPARHDITTAPHAVLAHAGERDAQGRGAVHRGDGSEHRVGRGPAIVFRLGFREADVGCAFVCLHDHVKITGGDVGPAGQDRIVVLRLHAGAAGVAFEPLREQLREHRGHVLCDQDGQCEVFWQPTEERGKGIGAAGTGGHARMRVAASPVRVASNSARTGVCRRVTLRSAAVCPALAA